MHFYSPAILKKLDFIFFIFNPIILVMKKLLLKILFFYIFILSSCYPSYVVSSGDVLDKGKASLNIGVFAPFINPGVNVRYGIGNKNELHLQSSLLSHELGFRHSIDNNYFSTKSSLGLTIGRGFFSYGTGEFVDEPSLWDPSDTTSQEITNDAYLTLLRAPFIFSWSEKENKVIMFGHIAPTLATKNNEFGLGMSLSVGANVKIKNNFGFCISPFIHYPLGGFNEGDFLGYKVDNPFFLYNFGIMFGLQLGQF